MFAIAGVTGNTGAVVAETLLSQGQSIRVIVRDAAKGAPWKARGAEVAIADLGDAAALTRALTGVAGAYLLVPPRLGSADPLGENRAVVTALAAAVTAAKLPHVVLLSSIGAQHAAGTGPIVSVHHAEQALGATGVALTAVRAAYFQENWGASLGMLEQGALPSFIPADARMPMVATRDIGRVAAQALVAGGKGRQVIELAGPQDYTPREVAAALERVAGRSVKVLEAPLDAVVPTFTGFGISREVAGLYREMYEAAPKGLLAYEGGAARAVRGTVAIDDTLRALLKK